MPFVPSNPLYGHLVHACGGWSEAQELIDAINNAGAGSVTSVGLALPNIFVVTGSPVTGAGTLTGSFANQSANTALAGPASGSPAAPAFRALVGNDMQADAFGNLIVGDPASSMNAFAFTNTGLGAFVLDSLQGGSSDTAIGSGALLSLTNGNNNTAVGANALDGITTGGGNIGIGVSAGHNSFVGAITTGTNSIFIGNNATTTKSDITNSMAIGASAIVHNNNQVVFGGTFSSGVSLHWGGQTAPANADIDTRQGTVYWDFTPGASGLNIKLKDSASTVVNQKLHFDTAANLFIGGGGLTVTGNGPSDLGADNVVIGGVSWDASTTSTTDVAGYALTDGAANVFIGSSVGRKATTGFANVGVGESALSNLTTGGLCVAIGPYALNGVTTSQKNVGMGWYAGGRITTGAENTMLGDEVGYGIFTGSFNTFVGGEADTTKSDITKSIAIGYKAIATNDNQCVIGSFSGPLSDVVINGDTTNQIRYDIISSASVERDAFQISILWATNTDATRKSRFVLNAFDTSIREVMRGEADGSASMIGFLGSAAVAQQASGANLTNNVTAGGTTDQIDDFTDLTTYATDAPAIRHDIYQLARKLKQVNDALRLYGLLT